MSKFVGLSFFVCVCVLGGALPVDAARAATADDQHPLAALPLRSIGPALTSGRVADFAFHPEHHQIYYVAMASAGVWKTTNNGISWEHVFRNEGSFATGVVVLDPSDPEVVWVGSGENNSQRSVGYGDGVYRSRDGGASWTRMGLENSGHISMIRFHPGDSHTVYVAAQGPLWSSGGDRGLYRSRDDGESWERIFHADDDTGVNEFLIHPEQPERMLASTYQRRRHVWTLINGGPGSGIHRSDDGGASWRRIDRGLPAGDLGRIGLAAAPSNPSIVYAIVEADDEGRGVYRSTDFGESWEKQSGHMTSSPQYYNELFVDPHDPDRVYAIDTFTHVSEDAGRTWTRLSIENRHVDDHALWIDPDNTEHLFIGGDGGIFESWDRGRKWRHLRNLPVTQFYRGTPDNDVPFYNICGGTQDNHTLCGPSRTMYADGITNADWWIAQFGDGFKPRIDPTDANVVYAQYQHGGLARFDRVTGERMMITPQPASGEKAYKWNWNSPLIISPHDHRRLYFGAERLFRSDDRGESWVAVSGDLSRGLDRNELEVMGRVWSVDAIAKNASTSLYGALIALDESPLIEGLLYAGTDDGLVHVSEDGGENWRRVDRFPGVPDRSLIEDLVASRHDPDVAWAVIDNHKRGDFKPYVLRTDDRGRSWRLISGTLPSRGSAHTLAEDSEDPALLFVGTEFGVFFTQDGGGSWHELTDLPTVAVRDLEIQRREDDLVISTFGLGFYLLEDLAPLRTAADELVDRATLFEPDDAWLYVPDVRRGWGGKGDYGIDRYAADNPPFGAVIAYYLPEEIAGLRDRRRADERERAKEGADNPYPDWERLRREDREEDPSVVITIRDSDNNVVRRIDGPTGKGYQRVAWDLRYPAPDPVNLNPPSELAPWQSPPMGPLVIPGTYSATLSRRVEGQWTDLSGPHSFELKPLHEGGLVAADPSDRLAFELEAASLYRAVSGADRHTGELEERVAHLLRAIDLTPTDNEDLAQSARELRARLADLRVALNGDATVARRYEPVPLPILDRIAYIVGGAWESQAATPAAYRESLAIAGEEFAAALDSLATIRSDLEALETELEARGGPWTPGRLPEWP
ncbi:hypothetical protein V3330_03710 [Wenzhouxiangellaceae bacterium CH-27]|uniref:Sortilin N-terminal domain-containing protein n=1 Tax=Elongatibacter sediminis TaxID=3119006 RepID=A0AAW9RGV1_9GAMM